MIISADIDQFTLLQIFAGLYYTKNSYAIDIFIVGFSKNTPREMFNLLNLKILNLNTIQYNVLNKTPFSKMFPHIGNCRNLKIIYCNELDSLETNILLSKFPLLKVY